MWLLEGDFWAVFQTHAEVCFAMPIGRESSRNVSAISHAICPQACAALSLSSSCFSVAPALESALVNLKRFDRSNATVGFPSCFVTPHSNHVQSPHLYMNNNAQRALHVSSPPVLHGASGVEEYMLSSNPPNPRTNFRLGDWMCVSPFSHKIT